MSRPNPRAADDLRAEGALLELRRIEGVYRAASHMTLDPLIERLMFDGKTQPEAAALAMVACRQTAALIQAEALRRRADETSPTPIQ